MMPADRLTARAEFLSLFETPVLHAQVADHAALTARLRAVIDRQRSIDVAGINRSNVGGWHSKTDMLTWGGDSAQQLADLAIRLAKRLSHFEERDAASVDWSVRMWANASPPGALNMSHAHPGVLWAASYYIDIGHDGEAPGGEIYFEDPRFPATLMTFPGFRMIGGDGAPQPVERRLETRAGDIVLFPAWIRHGVRPNQGSRDRVSIAMNIYARER